MKICICYLFIAFIIVGVLPLEAQVRTLKAEKNEQYEKQILELEYHLISLLASNDTSEYATYLSEDYIRINSSGKTSTKMDVLKEFAEKDSVIRQTSQTPSNIEIRIYGDTAIMNFDLQIKTIAYDKTDIRNSRLTKVFIRKHNRWYMVNNQGTALPK
ncbi:MAG: nuclear transport factor 2 family protein [Bacillota bacterium]